MSGEFLALIDREFAGVLPLFHTSYNQHLEEIVKHHGMADAVARYLYATPRDACAVPHVDWRRHLRQRRRITALPA
jgi:hypothetical protein